MIRWVAICLLFFGGLGTGKAWADSLNYQAVMHVERSHAIPVVGRSNHVVGVATFRGLAIFENGEIAKHTYQGWFDLIDGTGKFHGYAVWFFEDGSELHASYDGTARTLPESVVLVEAKLYSVRGSSRFSKAGITGQFSGRRLETIDKGGSTYLTGQLKIPEE